jgi:hypothetical protein
VDGAEMPADWWPPSTAPFAVWATLEQRRAPMMLDYAGTDPETGKPLFMCYGPAGWPVPPGLDMDISEVPDWAQLRFALARHPLTGRRHFRAAMHTCN